MKTRTLLPTDCHKAAARNFGRAAFARRLALKYPHTAERELENCRFWLESAQAHRRMAALVEAPADPMQEEYEREQRELEAHHAAELATFSAADIALAFGISMSEAENEANQLADIEADAEFYSSRTPISGREWG